MSNIKECMHEGCTNTFDIDQNQGVIVTKLEDKELKKKFYCCIEHKEN